ncbi:phosphate ABC transporter substrate-binding protein [Undibacter mobilis]|uniref:Phosphate ABC transporter substrate-binding protein n=1 Tax=Undibacter mobilis TaxID=2292256 RepID=A0A371B3R1_9BRAD|nr:phosphate ABC transporter substrate-binding protein [Undibacter mobilis]RDV02226.1 phosphate ABC transporter substrate-binding protein [Undibacter mobilis]
MPYPASGPVTLDTNLADYPVTRALKAGAVTSDRVRFNFTGPKVANQGFKPMVREGKFDAGELAIVTFLQAKIYGKPLTLLPAVVMARGQHHTIHYNVARGALTPKDIEGKRFGTRSYSVTTGVWVRGILKDEYGVDLGKVTWCTTDDGHLAEYKDPSNCVRLPAGSNVEKMLVDGELDGAILGGDLPDEPRVAPLFPDPHRAAEEWSKKNGMVPINHLFVVRSELAQTRPDVVREIFRVLKESKAQYSDSTKGGIDPVPFGVEANRKALETIIRYSYEQQVIPRLMSVDELFDDVTRELV